jgi:hypothetical protein
VCDHSCLFFFTFYGYGGVALVLCMKMSDMHDANLKDSMVSDIRRQPGNDPVNFLAMMDDTRAPPHVGPLIWAVMILLLYVLRHDSGGPYAVWVLSVALHILYVERKRWQRKSATYWRYWRYLLYLLQTAVCIAVSPMVLGMSWYAIIAQGVLFVFFFLEHSIYTAHIRHTKCDYRDAGIPGACRFNI